MLPLLPRTKRPLRTDELVDKAITRGLDWLAAHQDEDGRWDCDGFGKHDAGRAGARGGAGNPAHPGPRAGQWRCVRATGW